MDVLPTILDVAGGDKVSAGWNGQTAPPLPGNSLVPAFAESGAIAHEFLCFHHLSNRAIRVDDWKLVAQGEDGPWEFYDLKTDRCESKNLADKCPERVAEMSRLWQKSETELRQQAGPPQSGSG